MTSRRPKVLLSCYSCSPYEGSERGTGWNFLRRIAEFCEVHAIVEATECLPALERYKAEHPETFEHITLHGIAKVRHPLLRKIWPPSYYYFYDKWEKKAYQLGCELEREIGFDIVHRLTMCGYRRPGYLRKLGKPFVWGPVCGLSFTDWRLLPGLGLHGMVYFAFRNIINSLQMRYGRARKVAQHTAALLLSDPQALSDVERYWGVKAQVMREVGTEAPRHTVHPSVHAGGTPLRICWVGGLVTLKALPFVLRALPLCKQPMELHILGRGEKETEWKQLTAALGLNERVFFHGHLPHDEIPAFMSSCHVLCFSSIKEGGTPTVVLEAMQNGLPVICIDHCAFASVVNETCGIKIPVQFPGGISRDFACHLDKLAADEDLRRRLSHGAMVCAENYTWENKEAQLRALYAKLLEAQV